MQNQSFTIGGAIREGWELTKMNLGFLLVYQVILYFLMWLFNGSSHTGFQFSIIQLIGWIIIALGKMGFYNSALLLTKGLKPSFDQFYKNWRLFLSWMIASFIFGILFVIGFILLIFPGFYVATVFGFYPYFILDKGLGPIEALKESAQATKGVRLDVFLLFLTCIGLLILGLLFFGIGLLFTAPVTVIAVAVVYRKLTGQEKTSIQPDEIME